MRRARAAVIGAAVAAWFLPALFPQGAQEPPEPKLSEGVRSYIRALEEPSRDEWQKPAEVVEKLGLRPGGVVADLGAGSGYFTVRLARAVGRDGKVLALDVDPEMLEYVKWRAAREGLANIEARKVEEHDPELAPNSVDMIFICDTLHHIPDRATYYPLLERALRKGGRIVNVDFEKRPTPTGPPMAMRIAKDDCVAEFRRAGFRLAKEYDFLDYQYFLVFER